jgi:uncharacterized protein
VLEAMVRRFLYYPTEVRPDAPLPRYASDAREVWLRGAGEWSTHGLYWPPPPGRPTILFLHGNAETVYEWAMVRPELAAAECGLLLVDYPGYGKSPGIPTEEGLYAAARAALEFLRGEVGEPSQRVVVHGKSLGGAVATLLGIEERLLGVILESTFRSVAHMARRLLPMLPVGAVLRTERYDSIGRIGKLRAPLLLIHGDRDALVPLSEGVALFEAARPPKELWVVPGAGHNDVSAIVGDAYGGRIATWIDGLVAAAGDDP